MYTAVVVVAVFLFRWIRSGMNRCRGGRSGDWMGYGPEYPRNTFSSEINKYFNRSDWRLVYDLSFLGGETCSGYFTSNRYFWRCGNIPPSSLRGKKRKESITSKTAISNTLGPDERHAQRFSEIVMDIYWDTQYAFAFTSANSEYIFVTCKRETRALTMFNFGTGWLFINETCSFVGWTLNHWTLNTEQRWQGEWESNVARRPSLILGKLNVCCLWADRKFLFRNE